MSEPNPDDPSALLRYLLVPGADVSSHEALNLAFAPSLFLP